MPWRRSTRLTAGLALLLAFGALPGGRASAEDDATTVVFEVGSPISNLRRVDATGDGRMDLLLLSGRTVSIFGAPKGKRPPAKALHTIELPASVSFVDGGGADGTQAGLVTLGTEGLRTVGFTGAGDATKAAEGIGWRDPDRPSFIALRRPGGILLPRASGYRWIGEQTIDVPLQPSRSVQAAGEFLEDASTVTTSWPEAVIGRAPAHAEHRAVWVLEGRSLLAQHAAGRVRYDLGFLPPGGERRLVDLDGDALPDVLHIETTNKTGAYAFFRTRPTKEGASRGPDHKPQLSFLKLSGFQLDPVLVDLDRDGDLDFVITTIEVDAKNMLRALRAGRVTAQTQAFLNQGPDQGFRNQPDAVIRSDVGVRLRFTYSGSIEVERTLTIVADGDFDGDGRKDLAIRTGPSTLTIRRGTAAGVWEADGRTLEIPAPDTEGNIEGYSVDLDADGRHELVLVYRGDEKHPDRAVWMRP